MKMLKDGDTIYWVNAEVVRNELELSVSRNGERLFVSLPEKDLFFCGHDTEEKFYNTLKNNVFRVRSMFKKLDEAKANPKEAGYLLKNIQRGLCHELMYANYKPVINGVREEVEKSESRYRKAALAAGICVAGFLVSATTGFDGTAGLRSPLHWYTNPYITNAVMFVATGFAGNHLMNCKRALANVKKKFSVQEKAAGFNDDVETVVLNAYSKNEMKTLQMLKESLHLNDKTVEPKEISHEFNDKVRALGLG